MPGPNLKQLLDQGQLWKGPVGDPRQNQAAVDALPNSRQQHSLMRFGIAEIDLAISGGLPAAALHEWGLEHPFCSKSQRRWHAPLTLLTALFAQHLTHNSSSKICWIGRQCCPSAYLLEDKATDWLKRHLFIDPPNRERRLWASATALRSPTFSIVVADGSGWNISASRRIQLAAKENSSFAFIVRPPWELQNPSTAYSRWKVFPQASNTENPRWNVQLLRCRGARPQSSWIIESPISEFDELRENQNPLRLSADVVSRPGIPKGSERTKAA